MQRPLLFCTAAALALTGCATPANNYDPLEPVNRPIYKFNEVSDRYVLKPVAKGYDYVTPGFVKKGVSNFFNNIDDIFTAANGLLQGKPKQAGSDTARVLLNSTLGLAGLFDVASSVGLQKHDEDFGQTLGYWGVGSGPYLMLPLLGPSTLRDASKYPIDFYVSPTGQIESVPVRNSLRALNIVDKRTRLFRFDSLIEDALDPYAFVRDAYLQQRYNAVWDGKPPVPLKLNGDEDDGGSDPLADPLASTAPAVDAPLAAGSEDGSKSASEDAAAVPAQPAAADPAAASDPLAAPAQ